MDEMELTLLEDDNILDLIQEAPGDDEGGGGGENVDLAADDAGDEGGNDNADNNDNNATMMTIITITKIRITITKAIKKMMITLISILRKVTTPTKAKGMKEETLQMQVQVAMIIQNHKKQMRKKNVILHLIEFIMS